MADVNKTKVAIKTTMDGAAIALISVGSSLVSGQPILGVVMILSGVVVVVVRHFYNAKQ